MKNWVLKSLLPMASLLLVYAPGVFGQYDFTLTCQDTSQIVELGGDAEFIVQLNNTGSSHDIYRVTLTDSIPPGWFSQFCVREHCYPAGYLAYDTLAAGRQDLIAVHLFAIGDPGAGKGILTVRSEGDTTKALSLTLWAFTGTEVAWESPNMRSGLERELIQNYPNPFNAWTSIRYQTPIDGRVSLMIFNIQGQRVVTLVDSHRPADVYSVFWDGRDERGQDVASGCYLCHMRIGQYVISQKMLMLR